MNKPLSPAAWDFMMQYYDSEDGKLPARIAAAAQVKLRLRSVPQAWQKASEVVQEAFLAFAEIVDGKGQDRIEAPEAYLWTVALNMVKKIIELEYPEEVCEDFSAVEAAQLARVCSLVDDPEEQFVRDDNVTLVGDFVRSRPPLARDTLLLYSKGFTTQQIADEQGRSAEAVQQQRRRERITFHARNSSERLKESGGC